VRAQPLPFLLNILRWLLVAIPATWTNSWLSYIQNKLAIAYRTRLTEEVLKQYLGHQQEGPEGKTYYKLCEYKMSQFIILTNTLQANLDDRVKNPDQMITHDIQKFSNNLAAIYANLAKPVLDVILYNYQLSQNVGAEGLVLLTVLVQLSATLRKYSCTIMLVFECLSFPYHAHSAQVDSTIWSLYLNVRSAYGSPASHALQTDGICGRDCIFRG
jgi:ATP-binding cassette, subfamily D (ALD), peroxisomal long-chain fatty acid import protein